MKKIKNNNGFSLVECIVAMAVLTIMSLLLTMILSVTLNARNSNMIDENAIDSQVNKIASNDTNGVLPEDYTNSIPLKSGGWSELIPGNNVNGAKAYKKTYDGEDIKLSVLEYDFSSYDYSKSIPGGADPVPTPTPPKKTYKAELPNGFVEDKVKIKDNTSATPPTLVQNVDGTYTVIWEVSFNAKEKAPEKSVKLKLPIGASMIKVSESKTNCDVCAISNNVVRFGIAVDGDKGLVSAKISFVLNQSDFDNYINVAAYFTGDMSKTTNVIDLSSSVE